MSHSFNSFRFWRVFFLLVSLMSSAAAAQTQPIPVDARRAADAAMAEFARGGSREDYLAAMKALAAQPGYAGWYDRQIADLSLADKAPTGYDKNLQDRTEEERILGWIYELKDMPDPLTLPRGHLTVSPADRLAAAGYPAMDRLIKAAADRTLTRIRPLAFSTQAPRLLTRGNLVTRIIGRIAALRGSVSGQPGGSPDALNAGG